MYPVAVIVVGEIQSCDKVCWFEICVAVVCVCGRYARGDFVFGRGRVGGRVKIDCPELSMDWIAPWRASSSVLLTTSLLGPTSCC